MLSDDARSTAGILLLAIVAVEYGGWFLLRLVRGKEPATAFQLSFARAGHAHAAVLIVLALVAQVLVDATHLSGVWSVIARTGIPLAAILFPLGFFLSSMGRGRTEPNHFIWLLYLGALVLGVSVVVLGIGLLQA